MSVKKLVPTEHYDGETMPELARMVGDLVRPMSSDNATMEAMKEFFKEGTGKAPQKVIPFTSVTKYSGVTFEDQAYVLGARSLCSGRITPPMSPRSSTMPGEVTGFWYSVPVGRSRRGRSSRRR